jgi:hypothetical protein
MGNFLSLLFWPSLFPTPLLSVGLFFSLWSLSQCLALQCLSLRGGTVLYKVCTVHNRGAMMIHPSQRGLRARADSEERGERDKES